MKKVLLIVICCLCLCGCNHSNSNSDKDGEQKVSIENNRSDKYTFCFISSENSSITMSIYYDTKYNVIEDFSFISKTHNTISEAIKTEQEWQSSCENMNENVECYVRRNSRIVDIGVTDFKPNYYYKNKINELENAGWICTELDVNKDKNSN